MLNRIETSGLGENCDCLNFCILGDEKYLNINFPKNAKIHTNTNLYEFDTIRLLWKECQEEDMNVCYVHTKGVTKPGWVNVDDWRKYMSYFVIDKWGDRVNDLKEYDCTGVNLHGTHENYETPPETWGHSGIFGAPLHYSGNFWWSKSTHIRKIGDINKWPPDEDYQKWRMMCEMWLCQPKDSKYHCTWNSNVNHYIERYTEENYIERK
jgi:hypothetical protein